MWQDMLQLAKAFVIFGNMIDLSNMTQRSVVYRTKSGSGRETLGCGFIPKPDPSAVNWRFCYEESYCAVYLLRGSGIYRRDDVEVSLRAGDLVHRIPGQVHDTIPEAGSDWLEYFLLFPKTGYQALCAAGLFGENHPCWSPGLDDWMLDQCFRIKQLLSSVAPSDHIEAMLHMQRFLLEAWRLDCRNRNPASGEPDPLDRAAQLLQADLGQTRSAQDVAELLHLGYDSFRKNFKARYGTSPGQYRQRSKIDRARELLARNDMSVTEIAEALGYADIFTFSRQFRKSTGSSPTEFRTRF